MPFENSEFRSLAENMPTLCWAANPDGYIVWYNRRWYEYTGATPEQMEGWGWQSVHDPEILPVAMERWRACIASAQPFEMVLPLRSATGEFRPFLTRINPTFDETGAVKRWFGVNTDISDQVRAEAALVKSQASFAVLTDTMPQMVWSTLPNGDPDYFNARWYEFTGVPEGSTHGDGWVGVFHPDDQARAWARWLQALETGQPYEIEYRLRHHSGDYRWTLGRALPLKDAEGAIVRWFGTCTDIDDAKRLEEERSLVANELSHRIKNIFSVISGLIHLSTRSFPEAKSFATTLRERVTALGRAHDYVRPHSVLSQPQNNRTTLFAMLADLLAPYQDGERIQVSGEDTPIDDRAATPLALVFHELATNAAKYGALQALEGRVSIAAQAVGDIYAMTWTETGGPPAVEPTRLSFGSNLARISVEGQMGGELGYDWRESGLVVSIRLPLSALSRA